MRVFTRLGLVLLVSACSVTVDPLTERCLQALEYLEPEHGDIEAREYHASASRTAIVVRYLPASSSESESPRTLTCEFEAGERWNFAGIGWPDRDLSEMELTLINAEFLLRDLDRHPERLSGGPDPGTDRKRFEVAARPEHGDIPIDSGFSGDGGNPFAELDR